MEPREPLWLVPANTTKPRERLRSIGPVGDLSRQSLLDSSCLSHSLSHLDSSAVVAVNVLTPVAAIAPLSKNNNPPVSAPVTPHQQQANQCYNDDSASLPGESSEQLRRRSVSDRLPTNNTDYDPDPTVRWVIYCLKQKRPQRPLKCDFHFIF